MLIKIRKIQALTSFRYENKFKNNLNSKNNINLLGNDKLCTVKRRYLSIKF